MVTVDNSVLLAAVAARVRVIKSSRTVEQICVNAAYWIAVNTKQNTPFVEQETIASELGVVVNPVITKTGKVSTNKKRRFENVTFGRGDARQDVPLMALIISARANPLSNYNLTTNDRYALAQSPFKGVSRAEGAALMLAMARRMRAGRASSTHFLMSGWVQVQRALAPFVKQTSRPGEPPARDYANVDYEFAVTGSAAVVSNGLQASVFIENAIGMDGINAKNFNNALWQHGLAAFEQAIAKEAGLMMVYVEEAMAKGNYDFTEACK